MLEAKCRVGYHPPHLSACLSIQSLTPLCDSRDLTLVSAAGWADLHALAYCLSTPHTVLAPGEPLECIQEKLVALIWGQREVSLASSGVGYSGRKTGVKFKQQPSITVKLGSTQVVVSKNRDFLFHFFSPTSQPTHTSVHTQSKGKQSNRQTLSYLIYCNPQRLAAPLAVAVDHSTC